jgi:hypothetical protein
MQSLFPLDRASENKNSGKKSFTWPTTTLEFFIFLNKNFVPCFEISTFRENNTIGVEAAIVLQFDQKPGSSSIVLVGHTQRGRRMIFVIWLLLHGLCSLDSKEFREVLLLV